MTYTVSSGTLNPSQLKTARPQIKSVTKHMEKRSAERDVDHRLEEEAQQMDEDKWSVTCATLGLTRHKSVGHHS